VQPVHNSAGRMALHGIYICERHYFKPSIAIKNGQ
jgi:hypothetical protein